MKYNKFFAKSVFAFFVMSFVLILTSHAEVYTGTCGAEGHDLKWELNTEDSVLVISGTGTVMDDVVDKAGKRKKPWEKYKTFIACVELPSTLTHIGADMFSYCENLREINLPEELLSIGNGAFQYTKALTSISFPKGLKSIGNSAFFGCGLTSLELPVGLESLDPLAFSSSKIKTANLPDDMKIIPAGFFSFCFALKEVHLPQELERIDDYAFERCSSLSAISFPGTLTSIGEQAFIRCDKLSDVILPAGLTALGNQAFGICSELKSIRCLASTPPEIKNTSYYSWNMADNIVDWKLLRNVALTVPDESLDLYKNAKGWKEFCHINGSSQQEGGLYGYRLLPRADIIGNDSHAPALSVTLEQDYLHVTGTLYYYGWMAAFVYYELDGDTLVIRGFNAPYGSVVTFGFEDYNVDFRIGPIDHPIEKLNVIVTGTSRIKQSFTADFTGIDTVEEAPSGDVPFYDLLGRPTSHPTTGIYIRNGRKVMVR